MSRVQVMVDAGFSVRQAHAITGVIAATVSAAGSTQSDATLLESDNNLITTASAGQGVRLPSFNAGSIAVANGAAANVLVYPPTGGQINNDTANDPVTLAVGMAGIFTAVSSTNTVACYGGAPTTDSIGDGTVTDAKLAANAVGTTKIADGAVSNAKLAFVTGTWTPVITFATPGDLAVTYATQVGHYTRFGELALVNFAIATSAFTHATASGELGMTGLPFASHATAGQLWVGSLVLWGGITKAGYTHVAVRIDPNSSQIVFRASGSGVAVAAVLAADMPTAGSVALQGSVLYRVA